MQKAVVGPNGRMVSRIGIGGHYKAMEEGDFDARYGYVDRDVEERVEIIGKAIDCGITYYDTTWRNEVAMLSKVLRRLGVRDDIFVNGMVLGYSLGSKELGMPPEDYFNKWLDDRLRIFMGNRFDSFMINAIEEGYDDNVCQKIINVLEKRKTQGDMGIYGFSSHSPEFARKIADNYPEFEIIMVPYSFGNKAFEKAFNGYGGNASIVAMKPLVWKEYGVPFCVLNNLKGFETYFGFKPDPDIATKAFKYILKNQKITSFVCAINGMQELGMLLHADNGELEDQDVKILMKYNELQTIDNSVPLFLSSLSTDNLRMNYFGALGISRVLGLKMPEIMLNEPDSRKRIISYAESLFPALKEAGYERYVLIEGV